MRRAIFVLLVLLCIPAGLASCKTTSGGSEVVSEPGDPAELVAALLDKGRIVAASDVVVAKEPFFAGAVGDPEVKAVLDRLAAALEYRYSPLVAEIRDKANRVEWPVPQSGWAVAGKGLREAREKLDELQRIAIFKYPRYRPKAYGEAGDAVKAKEDLIRADAAASFAAFPLGSGKDFFALYPVALDAPSFLEENKTVWEKALAGMSAVQTDRFLSTYGVNLPSSVREQMAARYFKSLCPKGKNADLKEILSAYEQCKAAGMPLKNIPGIKVAFLQVTSPDLIKDKAIDFPINVKVDVPLEASKASMRKMFSHKAVKEADILVLMNVAVSKAKRVVGRNQKIESMYVASYHKEENPEYEIIRTELEAATSQYHAAQSRSTTSWMVSITAHIMDESQKSEQVEDTVKRMDELKDKLRNTPKYVSVPDYQPYPVTKAHMDIYKFATVNYYIVDKRKKVFFRDTFDVKEKTFFTVCYDLQDSDPNREKYLQSSVLEEDVVRYEMEPVVVNLSDLLDQYASRPSAWKKYASMGAVHRAVTKDTSLAQAKHDEETYGYDKYYDKRFDSVAVVRNLGMGLGSGFYVTEDMVLTNYHVVKENEYVSLKLFDKREVMGRVIARDPVKDLALIQADVKKKPVVFFDKRTIPLGVTVESIGHPDGFEFTITRGALSSIRKMTPLNYDESREKVLYIQSDASINGGNSGGPMFYGNYVVGVNDFKWLRVGNTVAEGLNFAIHYSEVFKFLDDNGITVRKGSK
jgi:S1-C subfamily serine protease